MKKNISTIFIVLIFIGGLLVFLYPTISNYYNQKIGSYAVVGYSQNVEAINNDILNQVLKKAEDYNKDLLEVDSNFINGKPKDEDYNSQLRIGNSDIMGYIEVEKINLMLPIYHGTSEGVLQNGVGHLEGSSLPIGGVGNHVVLGGHAGLPSAKLLSDLDKLVFGDNIVIKLLNETLTYSVISTNTVLPNDIELLKPQEDKDLLTLFTCIPYGVNSHRLLVTAERVEELQAEIKGEKFEIQREAIIFLKNKSNLKLGIIVFSLIIVVIIIVRILIVTKDI